VALRLRDAGFEPVIATSSMFRSRVESEGIAFHRLRPDDVDLERDLGVTRAQMVREVARRPQYILRRMLLPYLREAYEDCLEILAGAALVVKHSTALAAKLAAEKLHMPSPGHPFYEGQYTAEGVIALYSRVLGSPQPDHPPRMSIVGFAFYDADREGARRGHPLLPLEDAGCPGSAAGLAPALAAFLANGDKPLVFTLGTSAIYDAEDFIREGLAATAILGRRAVFVLDAEARDRWQAHASAGVLICGYVPYSQLFPHASVIVHHGGVGTTAQALRAGRPQLIVPYLVDQPDNADRVQRLGAGIALPLRHYRSGRMAAEVRRLIDDPAFAVGARRAASIVASEDGAGAAARIIAALLDAGRSTDRGHQRQ
jgi:UDP:flavonoid glycosyltransferase YjiC (YdhE family)